MDNYYVYVYIDPRKSGRYKYGEYEFDYEPFYVGKGSFGKSYVDRIDYHWKSVKKYLKEDGKINKQKVLCVDGNLPKVNKINKLLKEGFYPNNFCFKFKENLVENKSYELESQMIETIGRKDLGKGPLLNLTVGGEFHRFVKPWSKGLTKKTDSRLKRLSESRKGSGNPMFGLKQSENYYLSRKKFKGKPNKKHNRYKYIINNEEIVFDLKGFCIQNGIVYSTIITYFSKVCDNYTRNSLSIRRISL